MRRVTEREQAETHARLEQRRELRTVSEGVDGRGGSMRGDREEDELKDIRVHFNNLLKSFGGERCCCLQKYVRLTPSHRQLFIPLLLRLKQPCKGKSRGSFLPALKNQTNPKINANLILQCNERCRERNLFIRHHRIHGRSWRGIGMEKSHDPGQYC